jgi:hypothetical protein
MHITDMEFQCPQNYQNKLKLKFKTSCAIRYLKNSFYSITEERWNHSFKAMYMHMYLNFVYINLWSY